MKVLGDLEKACLESLASDPSTTTQGRIWQDTTTDQIKHDNGTAKRAVLKNDEKAIIGNDGTAANNVRLHKGSGALFQPVAATDATIDGATSAALIQTSTRVENYTDAGKPAVGNAGRPVWVTDLDELKIDNGSTYKYPVKFDSIAPTTTKGDLISRDGSTNVRIPVGVDGLFLKTNSATSTGLEWASSAPIFSQEFTGTTTWVAPANVTKVYVEGFGGGGGGGAGGGCGTGSGGGGGGGGGAGAPLTSAFVTVVPANTYNIIIGAGGTGGTGASNNSGTAGTRGTGSQFSRTGEVFVYMPAGGGGGGGGANSTNTGTDAARSEYTFEVASPGTNPAATSGCGGGGGTSAVKGPPGGNISASATAGINSTGGAGGGAGQSGATGGRSFYSLVTASAASGGTFTTGGSTSSAGGGGGGSAYGIGGAGGNGDSSPTAGAAAAANTGAGGGGGGGKRSTATGAGASGGVGGSGFVRIYWGF